MPQVKLYIGKGSCSLAPHALLRHLGVPFELVEMRLRPGSGGVEAADGSLTYAEYLRLNPTGFVPALIVTEDGGGEAEIVTEMPAVLTMIAHLAPSRAGVLREETGAQAPLLGRTVRERVAVAHWMAWLSGTLHGAGFAPYWRPDRVAGDDESFHPAVKEQSMKVITAGFARIEEKLRGVKINNNNNGGGGGTRSARRYAVGDALTVVDFNLYFFWRWAGLADVPMDAARYPEYARVLRQLEVESEGLRETLRVEGFELFVGP